MLTKSEFTEDELVLLYELVQNDFKLDAYTNMQVVQMLTPKDLLEALQKESVSNVEAKAVYRDYEAGTNSLDLSIKLSFHSYKFATMPYMPVLSASKPKPSWFEERVKAKKDFYIVSVTNEKLVGIHSSTESKYDLKTEKNTGSIYLTDLSDADKSGFIELFHFVRPRDLKEFINLQSDRYKHTESILGTKDATKIKLNTETQTMVDLLESYGIVGYNFGYLIGYVNHDTLTYLIKQRIAASIYVTVQMPYLGSLTDLLANIESLEK